MKWTLWCELRPSLWHTSWEKNDMSLYLKLALHTNITARKKLCTLLDLCVSSLRRGHANLLCIVPILTDGNPKGNPIFKVVVYTKFKHVSFSMNAKRGPTIKWPRWTQGQWKKLSAPEGVPRPSPTLVLTGPYHAWLRSSKGIRYFRGSMADSDDCGVCEGSFFILSWCMQTCRHASLVIY